MPDLKDYLINSFGNMNKEANAVLNSVFIKNKQAWVNEATAGFIKNNINPNNTLQKIASNYNLNEEQAKRLVEDTNVSIYLQKYAQTRGKAMRRVEFPLADLNLVMNKVSSEQIEGEKGDNKMGNELDKVAFDLTETSDSINFLNSNIQYDSKLWDDGNPEKVASHYIKQKISGRINDEIEKAASDIKEILGNISYVGNALIHNHRASQSAQQIMDKIAEEIGGTSFERPVINYVMKKTAQLKEQRMLPGNFEIDLKETSLKKDFSLGKHSLSKLATDTTVIEVPKLPDGTDMDKLIEVARTIEEDSKTDKIKRLSTPIVVNKE